MSGRFSETSTETVNEPSALRTTNGSPRTGAVASDEETAERTSAPSAIAWYSAASQSAERMPGRRRISSRRPRKFWSLPHWLRPSHISVASVWFAMSPAAICFASAPFTYRRQPSDTFFWNVRAKCHQVPAAGRDSPVKSWSFLFGVVTWIVPAL